MSEATGGVPPTRTESVRAEVLRPDDGASISVRILASGPILGAYFHYDRRRGGLPCLGTDCACRGRRTGAQWKGYVAAEEWIPHMSAWRAGALEITENAAVDLGGWVERGQIWVFSREAKRPGKAGKVTVALAEVVGKENLRPPFEVAPILWHLYRVHVVLEERCPIPPKPIMEVVPGDPPAGVKDIAPRVASPEEIREKLAKAGIRPPAVSEEQGRRSTVRYH